MTTTEDAPANLVEALAAVQAELPVVEKDQVGRVRTEKANYEYRYADLSAVSAAILPLLGKNGLAWTTMPTATENGQFVLRYTLMHSSGEKLEGNYPLPDPSRTPAQTVGSALTYARRYCLCAVTGLAPTDDDDDAAAAQKQAEYEQRPRARSSARARSSSARPLTDQATTVAKPARPEDATGPLTDRTRRNLFRLFGEAGLDAHKESDRALRLRACSKVVGRQITSGADLTEQDGRKIAALIEQQDNKAGWLASLVYAKPDDQAAESAKEEQ